MFFEAGNTEESVMRTVPLFIWMGRCASIRWLNVCGTAFTFAILSAPSGPGTCAGKM